MICMERREPTLYPSILLFHREQTIGLLTHLTSVVLSYIHREWVAVSLLKKGLHTVDRLHTVEKGGVMPMLMHPTHRGRGGKKEKHNSNKGTNRRRNELT